ncbi:hypothetical protein G6F62_014668 [Rhizopus arrhizus]|nr:hypothetical protein G6F62_014668 [Rhizopus arrhizus]
MRTMCDVRALLVDQAHQKRYGGVQHKRGGGQQPEEQTLLHGLLHLQGGDGDEEAAKCAAYVPHEHFGRRPVVDQEACRGQGERQAGNGGRRTGHDGPAQADRNGLGRGDAVNAVHEVVQVA